MSFYSLFNLLAAMYTNFLIIKSTSKTIINWLKLVGLYWVSFLLVFLLPYHQDPEESQVLLPQFFNELKNIFIGKINN
tara:strand:+ start:125 stop:358 length:234 start_codon:yes stop_codon:yes gene_type:complete